MMAGSSSKPKSSGRCVSVTVNSSRRFRRRRTGSSSASLVVGAGASAASTGAGIACCFPRSRMASVRNRAAYSLDCGVRAAAEYCSDEERASSTCPDRQAA